MASTDIVYGKARVALGSAGINLLTAAVNAMLVSSGYTPQPNVDQFVTAIPGGAIVVRDIALTSTGLTPAGVFFGTIPQFSSLISTSAVTALVLYVKGASDAVSPLLYYSSGGPGFPFTVQGFNYVVANDQANGGFFQA